MAIAVAVVLGVAGHKEPLTLAKGLSTAAIVVRMVLVKLG